MYWAALLAICHVVLATWSGSDDSVADEFFSTVPIITAPIIASTFTVSDTVYVMASQPASSDSELLEVKRDHAVYGIIDNVEATIVVATAPPALSTILSPQGSSAQMTALKDGTLVLTPGPSGTYGSSSNAGTNPGSGAGSGNGNDPGTGPGSSPGSNPGAGTGSGPGSGSGSSGEPELPSGAYGQLPNTTRQQSSSPTGGQPPNPAGQQTLNPTAPQFPSPGGQQSPSSQEQQPSSPTGGQSPNPTSAQSPNPAGQLSLSSAGTTLGVTIVTVPLLGTVVETVTISLESAPAPGNGPVTTITQTLPTTFTTIQASNPLPVSCESITAPWGPLSVPITPALPTTFVTVSGTCAGGPSPISIPSSMPSIVTVTVPGNQEPLSASVTSGGSPTNNVPGPTTTPNAPGWATTPNGLGPATTSNVPGPVTTPNVPGWATIPNVPSWATTPRTTVTVPNSVYTSHDTTGPQTSSSTCTTGVYTNVISTSTAQAATTAAATLAVGSSTSQHTTWSFGTSTTATPTVALVTGTNGAYITTESRLSVIYSVIVVTFLTSIARWI
ncbi:hypothetical protein RRF57_000441 [Xylaria bambusicola]|uniref:Uncharacterized protein n=1 Tax=Xylaria bambusicola TaxID=326684 RepID=A0AAN7YU62_9PEZI